MIWSLALVNKFFNIEYKHLIVASLRQSNCSKYQFLTMNIQHQPTFVFISFSEPFVTCN